MMACNNMLYRQQDFNVRQLGMVKLPRLNIAVQTDRPRQTSPRRDSMGSSTGDSGYNSDPGLEGDMSLSPVEFGGLEPASEITSEIPLPPAEVRHHVTSAAREAPAISSSLALIRKHRSFRKSRLPPKIEVTSCPAPPSTCQPQNSSKLNNNSTKVPPPEPLLREDDIEQWAKDNLNSQSRPVERNLSIVSLSSSGSCEMYSSNNNSEDEDHEPSSLSITAARNRSKFSPATVKTIELILRKIELHLNDAAYIQCVEAADAQQYQQRRGANEISGNQSRGSTGGRNNNNHTAPSQASNSNANKRKSRLQDLPLLPLSNNPDGDDNDENPNKRRRTSVATTTTDSEVGPKFACPFFKHDPTRYRNRRTCPGPGWPTVHRMKEHLYRAHAQPIFCPRCYAMFDSEAEFSSHIRARPCPVSDPLPIDGIDRETLKGLHKRSPAGRLEEEKWRDAYLLLFPDVEVGDIPSPYYTELSPSDDSRRFRRLLLDRIRTELYVTAERDPNSPIEQRLLRQVAAIIQRCEAELLETFQPTPSTSAPQTTVNTSSSSRRTSTSATAGKTAADASIPIPSISPPEMHQAQPSTIPQPPPTFTLPFAPTTTHPPQPYPPSSTIHLLPSQQHPPISPGTFPHLHPPGEPNMHDIHPHDSFPSHSAFTGGETNGHAHFDFSSGWLDWYPVLPGDYDGVVDEDL